jgi:hypothetical protein
VSLFEPPLVRRLVFRTTMGERVSQWALTRQGEALLELKAAGCALPAAFRATVLRARTVLSRAKVLPAADEEAR